MVDEKYINEVIDGLKIGQISLIDIYECPCYECEKLRVELRKLKVI